MSVTGDRMQERRKKLGISADILAEHLGVSRSTIFRYENGDIEKVPANLLPDIAKFLKTSEAYLMGWRDVSESEITNIYPIERKRFPMLDKISCGEPIYANEERESYIIAGTNINADFCLRAKGESMINARICDGDIVFIKKQEIVSNGEIAAVVVNDDNEATLKRFFYYADKNMVILKAENPAYEDMILTNDELNNFHVLGKAVAFQSDVK